MKISSLEIENFRAIRRLVLKELGSTVVVAGANGCGKTQIYNAVRLLKSTYGGYQQNEFQKWWGEFNIRLDRPGKAVERLFGDPNRPFKIKASFEVTPEELSFLRSKAESTIRAQVWQRLVPDMGSVFSGRGPAVAELQRSYGTEVERITKEEYSKVTQALAVETLTGEMTVAPGITYEVAPNPGLELLFSIYEPDKLGVIDYHGAQRSYNREQIGGINLSIEQSDNHLRQHALYNWQNKYTNVKQELAAGYIRQLISAQAGVSANHGSSLIETLQELFATFFPGKTFNGPVPGPDGTLDFPVSLEAGSEHDIDDLSSGEKEVLFGYLRLRNSAPKNSIVLIDEPELHLNPALLRGFPQFYHKHIGRALGNQIWLITHSDALLREAVGQPDFSVYHMQPPELIDESGNQLQPIEVGEQLDRAIVDLVGDLATYRPGAKVVFFEGGGDVDFDVRMTSELFPRFAKKVNAISVGSRTRVEKIHDLLRIANEKGGLGARFFSIVDQDSGAIERAAGAYQWDRYHIENYLLEPLHILAVLKDLNLTQSGLSSVDDVQNCLKKCAEGTLDSLIRYELEQYANGRLVSGISTKISRDAEDIPTALRGALEESRDRLSDALRGDLALDALKKRERQVRVRFKQDLKNDRWLTSYRGRDVLRSFIDRHVKIVKYEIFRDLVVAKMRDAGYEPDGMRTVTQEILSV
jgi:predicted ATPase